MKEKESEWVSIGDAMASIIAILIFFMIAILLNSVNQTVQANITLDSLKIKKMAFDSATVQANLRRQTTIRLLKQFYNSITEGTTLDQAIELDTVRLHLRFKEGAFESGSPCFHAEMQARLETASESFRELLKKNLSSILIIEGYTDSTPFHGKGDKGCLGMETKYNYMDNIGLSASRALEGKRILTIGWEPELSERVAVAGYGFTKYDFTLSSDENRRVIFKVELSE